MSLVGRAVGEVRDGRDARWEPHRAARRALILDAAIELLEESNGADLHVQRIAERAGLGRAVVYRHFDDRAAIERAVRGRVFTRLIDELAPAVHPDGSIGEIIERIVRTYVGWASLHPVLHRLISEVSRHFGEEDLDETVVRVSEELTGLARAVIARLGLELSPEDEAMVGPLVLGMVGHTSTVVRSWLEVSGDRPTGEELVQHLARGFWYQFDGHARARGIELDEGHGLGPEDSGR